MLETTIEYSQVIEAFLVKVEWQTYAVIFIFILFLISEYFSYKVRQAMRKLHKTQMADCLLTGIITHIRRTVPKLEKISKLEAENEKLNKENKTQFQTIKEKNKKIHNLYCKVNYYRKRANK